MAGLQDLLMGGMKSGALGVVPQMMAGGDAGGIGGLPIGIGLMALMKGMNQQQQPQQQPNQEPPAWYTEAPQWMQDLPAQQRDMYANSFGGMQKPGMMRRPMRRPLPLQQEQSISQQSGVV